MPAKNSIVSVYKDRVTLAASKKIADPVVSEADYDECLTEFLRSVNEEKNKAKMHWYLMREGMKSVVDRLRQEQRREVKALAETPKGPSVWEQERAARKRERARYYKEQKQALAQDHLEYAEKHGIEIYQVADHKAAVTWKSVEDNLRKAVSIEANKRASAIMLRWLCGGKPLAACTGQDLDASARKEENQAEGHLQNAFFYRRLRTFVADAETVQGAVDPDKFLEVFDDIFGAQPDGFSLGITKSPEGFIQ
jgi:hypothetical protein